MHWRLICHVPIPQMFPSWSPFYHVHLSVPSSPLCGALFNLLSMWGMLDFGKHDVHVCRCVNLGECGLICAHRITYDWTLTVISYTCLVVFFYLFPLVTTFCEHVDESVGYIKDRTFLELLLARGLKFPKTRMMHNVQNHNSLLIYHHHSSRWGEFLNLPNLSGRTRPWGLLSL
jgi:hypothetical protein